MKPIKVRISSDGIHARECNPLGEVPKKVDMDEIIQSGHSVTNGIEQDIRWEKEWQQAESSLRSFEIESIDNGEYIIGDYIKTNSLGVIQIENDAEIRGAKSHDHIKKVHEPNSIHTAELLENGRIKIID